MKTYHLTKHAQLRLAQRALNRPDVDLIMTYGSEVCDGYMMLDRDCDAIERACRALMDQARRLKGKRLVHIDGLIVTAFHASQSEERRILRNTNERMMEIAA